MSTSKHRARTTNWKKRPRQTEFAFIPGLPGEPTDSLAEHYATAKGTLSDMGLSPRQFAADATYAARRLRK